MSSIEHDDIRQKVRNHYAQVAHSTSSCCSGSAGACCSSAPQESEKIGYSSQEIGSVPDGANMGLGCGNPQAIASLKKGEIVVDLGSGGGFDCFLAARQVGDCGKVIGIDMTSDMVSTARRNAVKSGFSNVEFRLGEIENLPVADNSADVIISNCVINLSPDKQRVFNEAYRILKTGGRLAISDVVATAQLPPTVKQFDGAYCSCISGAVRSEEIKAMLGKAGFCDISISLNHASGEFIKDWLPNSGIENFLCSAAITAYKK
ncbi:MAG: arsenite methyltransferase [Chitinivibrionales bacterium]|nr:arsenite methyltransferase [Chitinivibrionales bacterium]